MASLLGWVGKKIKGAEQTVQRDIVKPVANVVHRDVVSPIANAPSAVDNYANKSAVGRGLQTIGLGALRSGVGTVQGIAGLDDALNHKLGLYQGTSPFSRSLDKLAKNTDITAKENHSNPLLYHGAQTASDLLQFATGGGELKAGVKLAETAPRIGKVVRPTIKATNTIENGAARVTQGLRSGNVAQRVIGRTAQNVLSPKYQATNAAFTALQSGKDISQGKKVTPREVATNLAMGGVAFPAAGAVGHEVAAPAVKLAGKAVKQSGQVAIKAGEKALTTPDIRVNLKDQNTLRDHADYLSGAYKPKNSDLNQLLADVRTIGQKYGVNLHSGTFADRLNRNNAILDQIGKKNRSLSEGGYIRVPGGGEKPNMASGKVPEQSASMPSIAPQGKVSSSSILDPLAALKQEALKYKSADEFVNSQVKKPVYKQTAFEKKFAKSTKKATENAGFTNLKATDTPETPEYIAKRITGLEDNVNRLGENWFGPEKHAWNKQLLEHYKAKQQLTDLYNQAHAGAKAPQPTQAPSALPGIPSRLGESTPQASLSQHTTPRTPIELPKARKESVKLGQTGVREQGNSSAPFDSTQYIAEQTKLQQAAQGKSSKLGTLRKEVSTKMIDALSPIEKPVEAVVGRQGALPLRNQLDRSLRADTLAGQFAKDNGLHDIVNSVPDTKAFDQYLIAKHAQDLEANGVKTGRNLEADKQLIDQLSPTHEAAAKNLSNYNNKLLDQTVKYGLISKDTAAYLKQKYPNYVPFDRIFSDTELANRHTGTGGSPASLSKQTVVQRIQGSDRQISSPLENILAKTHDVVAQGERNLAAKEIIKTKDLPGNPLGIVPLRTASDVKARIDLYSQAKELKPAQAKLQHLLKTQDKWARKLQSQLDSLNQKGLEASLKAQQSKAPAPILSGNRDVLMGTKRISNPMRDIPTLTGTVKTKQFSRAMTATETKKMVNNLVNMTKPELERIKSRIATKENKLAPVIDQIEELRTAVEGVKNNRQALIDEARLHSDALAKGKDTIATITDGIKEVYEVSPEVAAAAKSLNKQQLGLVGKILSYPTRALRLGATGINVGFTAANITKDVATAALNSEHPFRASVANPRVFVDALAASFWHSGKNYAELTRQGAGGTSFDIARNAAPDTIKKIRSERNVGTRVLYTVRHPSELLRAVEDTIGRSEELGRALQYFGNKNAALHEGKSLEQATQYGADAARNNTTNFARAGEYGRVLNSVLPYFNAGIQGSRTLVRNIKNRPVQTTSKLVIGSFVPIATVTAWNLNDPARKEAYDDIPDYEKQGNIIIVPPNPHKDPVTGRWNVIKIPVSQEVANANNVVRNGVEALSKDAKFNFAQMAANLSGTATSLNLGNTRQILNQVTPQAIKPAIEVATNQNLYTGNKIVPDSKANLAPKDQYGDYTSGTAKVLGRLTNTSPYQLDNAIKTTFAGAGQNAVNISDNALAKAKVIQPSEVKGKSFNSGVTDRFYTAAGGSGYTNADKAFADARKKLSSVPSFQNLSPDDKAKELNRLQNDLTTTEVRKYDAKYSTGQYAPTNATSQKKLTKNQTAILENGLDVNNYTKTTADKAAVTTASSTPLQKYQTALKNYNEKQKTMTSVQKYAAQQSIAKLSVQKDYSNDVISLYGLSKAKLNSYFSTQEKGVDKQAVYKQLQAYDQALYDSGLSSTLKLKYGLSTASKGGKGTKGGKGKKGSATTGLSTNLHLKAPKAKKFTTPKVASVYKKPNLRAQKTVAYSAPKITITNKDSALRKLLATS